jgi:hypothetical protein
MTTAVHIPDAAGLMGPDRRQELTDVAERAGHDAVDATADDADGRGECPGPRVGGRATFGP